LLKKRSFQQSSISQDEFRLPLPKNNGEAGKGGRHKQADHIPLFKSSETQTIDENQKNFEQAKQLNQLGLNKDFPVLAATSLAACLEPSQTQNLLVPAMLSRFHANSHALCMPSQPQVNMLSQPLANYLAPPPAVCHMPMTPSLKHSASMRAARGNMLWEAPESTPLSLLSQMSSGSNANIYNKRHKR